GTLGWNPIRPLALWTVRWAVGVWRRFREARAAARETARVAAEIAAAAGLDDAAEAAPPEASLEVRVLPPDEEALQDEEAVDAEGARATAGGADAGAWVAVTRRSLREPLRNRLLPDPRDPRELAGDELPPLDLLSEPTHPSRGEMERDLDQLGKVLIEKLRSFGVESELGGRTTGPVVTQFEVIPAPGVKVNKIANLDRDLALAMRAKTVRIVAPIPGKGAVGVEIPNPVPFTVQVREILESPAFMKSQAELPLALGKDLHGEPYVADLTRMPHALIAGATGSGKSVCLNTIITSLVYRHTPETLRLLLIDPKMVELSTYADLPHLRHPVVTDPRDAAGVLKWTTLEMERRYALLSENGVRSIGEFNRRVRKGVPIRSPTPQGEEGDPDRWIYREGVLPFVVLVVDELADLMMTVQSEIEKPLTLLAQKARAIGLHLIVATQRPSVNVITGLIKANFPCRMAFRVASKIDSRTILDQNGADALLGDGDMLFLPPGQSEPVRIQGAFISTEETEHLLDWYRDLRDRKLAAGKEPYGVATEEDILEVVRAREAEDGGEDAGALSGKWDDLFREAAEICIRSQQGSTSLLQRRLKIGYGRAARIVDQMHEAGVLGPPDGSRPREILMSLDQLERMLSPGG
ncbi:MAG: DNA translocase FtsK, partial [Gemmatimonadetes bacterium]|nr:DNA translocase FtsK [Gemmatimonadota bacterium]